MEGTGAGVVSHARSYHPKRQESNIISHTLAEVLTSDLQEGGIWVGSWEKVGADLKQGSSQA